MSETQVEKFMRLLDISKEEAENLVSDDKKIDKGEKMDFDLTKEQQKTAKEYTKTGTKKHTVYKFDTAKSRKENPTKASIISEIANFLSKTSENACELVQITNKERQISFKIGENDYELTLVQKRKAKK